MSDYKNRSKNYYYDFFFNKTTICYIFSPLISKEQHGPSDLAHGKVRKKVQQVLTKIL